MPDKGTRTIGMRVGHYIHVNCSRTSKISVVILPQRAIGFVSSLPLPRAHVGAAGGKLVVWHDERGGDVEEGREYVHGGEERTRGRYSIYSIVAENKG